MFHRLTDLSSTMDPALEVLCHPALTPPRLQLGFRAYDLALSSFVVSYLYFFGSPGRVFFFSLPYPLFPTQCRVYQSFLLSIPFIMFLPGLPCAGFDPFRSPPPASENSTSQLLSTTPSPLVAPSPETLSLSKFFFKSNFEKGLCRRRGAQVP